ncbi:phage regulatory CII family protein [Brucella anthropi]|uniref:phage regulatory CII family protein n=1 Tax=Brucella anthropi TaxID=529 RepID=UPI00124EC420|nr:phage regulatory CII family protein [Brucella anthropi]KAB2743516.1 hypothetical protein F9L05_23145 [Brucella anthropi]
MRTISEQEQRSLKAATDGAYVLGGGISCILPFTRVGVSTLSKYASYNDEHRDNFIPADIIIEIDRRTKSPVIVRAMAALLGFDLVPIAGGAPDAQADAEPLTEKDAHRVMSESMDVSQAILHALDDNRIDALERRGIAKELRESIRAQEDVLRRLEVS